MNNGNDGLLAVNIDFEQSHLFFPRIIVTILAILLVIIVAKHFVTRARDREEGKKRERFRFFEENYDKLRLWGTIGLMVIYFFAMDFVGQLFPNQGFGFLFTSIPFMVLVSFLFVGKSKIRERLLPILLSSILTPLIVWFVLGRLFYITLP